MVYDVVHAAIIVVNLVVPCALVLSILQKNKTPPFALRFSHSGYSFLKLSAVLVRQRLQRLQSQRTIQLVHVRLRRRRIANMRWVFCPQRLPARDRGLVAAVADALGVPGVLDGHFQGPRHGSTAKRFVHDK